jgi:hypothetical protein
LPATHCRFGPRAESGNLAREKWPNNYILFDVRPICINVFNTIN